MKRHTLYIILSAALAALVGCNDIVNYDEGYVPMDKLPNTGAPIITAIYHVADTGLVNPITEGQMGEMIRIVGSNLNHVQSITFNAVEADLTQTYTYSTSANVVIPTEPSSTQDNTLVYTTDMGTATFDFAVPFPALRVDGVLCEFVNAGDSMTVLGENFDFYHMADNLSVTTADANDAPLPIAAVSRNSLKVVVPAGTPDNTTFYLEWTDSGDAALAQAFPLPFRPTTHLLYGDFDLSDSGVMQMALDGKLQVTVEGDDAVTTGASALGHNHLHFTGTFDAWDWNTCDLSCNMIDAGDLSNPDAYEFKFEVLTPANFPLTEASTLQFTFNWGTETYTWKPGDGQGLNTHGQWQTVALPLTPMATAGMSDPGVWQSLRIIFQPSAAYQADFRLGNFRIERRVELPTQ